MRVFWIISLLLLASCDKYYLSLREVPVDASYLASTHARTPDPRKDNPPHGQKVVLQWSVPPEILDKQPQILFRVIYKNHTEKEFIYPIESRLGYTVYSLLDQEFDETGGLLTYSADVMTSDHVVFREWKHQLWVNLITLE
jgi:hypothetical protein